VSTTEKLGEPTKSRKNFVHISLSLPVFSAINRGADRRRAPIKQTQFD
jgi:hypothetical protein